MKAYMKLKYCFILLCFRVLLQRPGYNPNPNQGGPPGQVGPGAQVMMGSRPIMSSAPPNAYVGGPQVRPGGPGMSPQAINSMKRLSDMRAPNQPGKQYVCVSVLSTVLILTFPFFEGSLDRPVQRRRRSWLTRFFLRK